MTAVSPSSASKPIPAHEEAQPRLRWYQGRRTWLWACLAFVILACGWSGQDGAVWWTNSRAQVAIAQRDYPRAQSWLEWSDKIAPQNAQAEFLRARTERHRGNNHKVREHLKRASEFGHPIPILEREQILAAAQNGQMREALPHFRELLLTSGDDGVEICEAFCQGFYRANRIRDLMSTLEPWMKDYPEDDFPWYLRGRALRDAQKYVDAEKDLREALQRNPHNPLTQHELGECLVAVKRPEEALVAFRQAAGEPQVAQLAIAGEARCLVMLTRVDEARAVLEAGIKTLDNPGVLMQQLGQLEQEAGNFEVALKWIDRALLQYPNNIMLRNSRGSCLRSLKRLPESKQEMEFVRVAREALDKAQLLKDQVDQKNNSPELRYEIGCIYLKYTEPSEGVRWLLSALEYDPVHQPTHRRLLEYYQARQDQDPSFKAWADYHRSYLRTSAAIAEATPSAATPTVTPPQK